MPFDSLRHNRVLRDWANEPDAMFAQAWFEAIGYNVYTRESIVTGGKLGIDATKLEPPVRSNEAIDVRVMALTNAMKAEPLEGRSVEPFARWLTSWTA